MSSCFETEITIPIKVKYISNKDGIEITDVFSESGIRVFPYDKLCEITQKIKIHEEKIHDQKIIDDYEANESFRKAGK